MFRFNRKHIVTRAYMSHGKCKVCGDSGELINGYCYACYHMYVENDN